MKRCFSPARLFVDGELAGRGNGGVEQGAADHDGDAAELGGDGGIEHVKGAADLGLLHVELADGLAGADAGHGEAEIVVAEAGDIEEGADEALFPGQGQGAHAAAEAGAAVVDMAGDLGSDLDQGGGGGEEVHHAVAVDVGLGVVDAEDDMAGRGGGEVWPGGAMKAAGAGLNGDGGGAGEQEVGCVAAAIAVADDDAAGGGLAGRFGEPAADAEAVEAVVVDLVDFEFGLV